MLPAMKENKRLQVVQEVVAQERTVGEAARVLCVSGRHVYRIVGAGQRQLYFPSSDN